MGPGITTPADTLGMQLKLLGTGLGPVRLASVAVIIAFRRALPLSRPLHEPEAILARWNYDPDVLWEFSIAGIDACRARRPFSQCLFPDLPKTKIQPLIQQPGSHKECERLGGHTVVFPESRPESNRSEAM